MKKLLSTFASVGFALSLGVIAATPAAAKEPTAQQQKMATCNTDAGAKDLKGDDRKAFMKSCLSNKPAKATTQQEKMKTCNVDAGAKELKGDERKAFMKECLSNKPA
ncbi:PsiF family protein [Diaphorobacter aerolatus]|uniref:Phosphate starvation-inducible protein PsiF n=1 Tax=Diaphorobacter aerolatus TaxID=1288495 RepID=A0A7H0GPT3_9BURK|nr:PsiF family protein [Diaphorobacter aerolatus]QNP50299.1 phosphate starvation-inducible protein PsiF [Diaphorobacter aerolatus]